MPRHHHNNKTTPEGILTNLLLWQKCFLTKDSEHLFLKQCTVVEENRLQFSLWKGSVHGDVVEERHSEWHPTEIAVKCLQQTLAEFLSVFLFILKVHMCTYPSSFCLKPQILQWEREVKDDIQKDGKIVCDQS